ncbi:MAG: type VII secretion protein EssC, partial [Lachnospiraceae bacterium]
MNKNIRCFQRDKNFSIGAESADIEIKNLGCHLIILDDSMTISRGKEEVEVCLNELSCEYGLYYIIKQGDSLHIKGYIFTFLADRILLRGDSLEEVRTTLLEMTMDESVSEEFPKYKRSPRIIKRVTDKTIQLSKPKEQTEKKRGGLVALILPSLAMMCVTVGVSILMKRGMFILISIAGTGVTMIASIVKYIADKKEYKEEIRKRKETYQNYLLKKRKEIYQAFKREKEAYRYNYPDVKEIESMIHSYSERIYERSANDEDFLAVSVGKVYAPTQFKIKMPTEDINSKMDELVEEAKEIVNEFSKIEQPVAVDLKKAHLGLV